MLRIHDFHIDFQFRTNLVLPRDFQMALTHPWLSLACARSRMDPETQWMVFGDLYRYPHVHLSVLLVYDHLGAFYTHPIGGRYKSPINPLGHLCSAENVRRSSPVSAVKTNVIQISGLWFLRNPIIVGS